METLAATCAIVTAGLLLFQLLSSWAAGGSAKSGAGGSLQDDIAQVRASASPRCATCERRSAAEGCYCPSCGKQWRAGPLIARTEVISAVGPVIRTERHHLTEAGRAALGGGRPGRVAFACSGHPNIPAGTALIRPAAVIAGTSGRKTIAPAVWAAATEMEL